MKKIVLTLFATIFVLVILMNIVAAANPILLCWKKGETVQFSKCNSQIDDKKCTTSTCKQCVTNPRSDVYCPANINLCNSKDLECTYLSTPNDEGIDTTTGDSNTDTNTDNTNDNQDTTDNTNTDTTNSNNDNTNDNTNTGNNDNSVTLTNSNSNVKKFNIASGIADQKTEDNKEQVQKEDINRAETGSTTKKAIYNNPKFIVGFFGLMMILEIAILFLLIKKPSFVKEQFGKPLEADNKEQDKDQKSMNKRSKKVKSDVKNE